MNFISFRQMIDDVRAWSRELPSDLVAVAGIPRSGMLPALHLALHRNVHLVSFEELKAVGGPGKPGCDVVFEGMGVGGY